MVLRGRSRGTAASTSSQPQAVMDSSADTSAPLAYQLAGGRRLLPWDAGFSIGCPASKSSSVRGMPSAKLSSKRSCSSNRSHPDQSETRQEPKRTGSGYPHRRSGSEADSMSRGGYPVTGRPSSKPSSNKQTPTNEAAIRLTQAVNEALSSAVPKPHKPQQTKSASQGGAFHRGSDHFFFLGATIITIWRPSRRGIDSTWAISSMSLRTRSSRRMPNS